MELHVRPLSFVEARVKLMQTDDPVYTKGNKWRQKMETLFLLEFRVYTFFVCFALDT